MLQQWNITIPFCLAYFRLLFTIDSIQRYFVQAVSFKFLLRIIVSSNDFTLDFIKIFYGFNKQIIFQVQIKQIKSYLLVMKLQEKVLKWVCKAQFTLKDGKLSFESIYKQLLMTADFLSAILEVCLLASIEANVPNDIFIGKERDFFPWLYNQLMYEISSVDSLP